MGCDGCELWQSRSKADARRSCYAGILHERADGTNAGFAVRFEEVTRFPSRVAKAAKASGLRGLRRLEKPWLDGMPRMWFVSDMGDALSKDVSFEYLHAEIIDVVRSLNGRRHLWLWLTKRPERMREFSNYLGSGEWPPNLWAGTSITEPRYVDRIDQLRDVGDERTVRFLSVEPQHRPVDLDGKLAGIGWVIQGGESGPTAGSSELLTLCGARPFDVSWARSLRDLCCKERVPYFLKQLGSHAVDSARVKLRDRHGGDWAEWFEDLRVRQVPQYIR